MLQSECKYVFSKTSCCWYVLNLFTMIEILTINFTASNSVDLVWLLKCKINFKVKFDHPICTVKPPNKIKSAGPKSHCKWCPVVLNVWLKSLVRGSCITINHTYMVCSAFTLHLFMTLCLGSLLVFQLFISLHKGVVEVRHAVHQGALLLTSHLSKHFCTKAKRNPQNVFKNIFVYWFYQFPFEKLLGVTCQILSVGVFWCFTHY